MFIHASWWVIDPLPIAPAPFGTTAYWRWWSALTLANPDYPPGAFFKGTKAEAKAERQGKKAAIVEKEDRNKTAARKRDGWMCRFPRCGCHQVRTHPECAHVDGDKWMGGDHGTKSHHSQLMCLCPNRHKDSRISLHFKTLRIEFLTAKKANGPVRWYLDTTALTKAATQRISGDEKWAVLATETEPRVLAPLSAKQGGWLEKISELKA